MNLDTRQIARRRIQILFQNAKRTYKAKPQLSQTYLHNARKIAMAARLRIPSALGRQICRKCSMLLVPGETSRVRIRSKREPHVVTTCLNCGDQARIPLKPKHKE